MTNESFKQIMALLSEQYQRNVSPLMAKAYWQVLKDFTNEQVEKAVMDYIGDPDCCNFWPQPGAIKAKITGTGKQQDMSIEDSAMTAWNIILGEIRRVGAYGNLEIDDKVAMKAVQNIGGWQSLCHSTDDALKTWKRKEFISAYKTFVGADSLPESLRGIGQSSREHIEWREALKRIQGGVKDVNQCKD
jgi:hypothetical protein